MPKYAHFTCSSANLKILGIFKTMGNHRENHVKYALFRHKICIFTYITSGEIDQNMHKYAG